MIAMISFDLDGTLVETGGEIAEAANRTLHDFGIAARPQAEIEALIGGGSHVLMRRLLTRIDPAQSLDTEAVLQRFERHYAVTAGTSGRPYPGCAEGLQRLRDDGVPLACVTNKEQRHAERVLEAGGLRDAFVLLVGGDSLAWKKPDRLVLAHVLAALGATPAEAVHVGDSATDLAAARNAGVADWAVSWGYNAGTPIARELPSRLFDSFVALADAVLEERAAGRGEPARRAAFD